MDFLCWHRKNKNKDPPITSFIASLNERNEKFLNSIIKEKSFKVSKITDCGYYGGCIIIKNKKTEIKARVLKKEYAGEHENKRKIFRHRNIQPLLALDYLPIQKSYIFYSAVGPITLEDKIKDKLFRNHTQSLWRLVSWLENISDAMQYIHSKGYALLNLKAQNLVVNQDDVVQISDFHNLNRINSRTNRFGISQPLRAPETFLDGEGLWAVKPQPFESWTFGILIIEMFTNFYLCKKLPKNVSSWTKQVYPVIYNLLGKYKFDRVVRRVFPNCQGTVDLKIIRYLVAYTLSFHPSRRPPAKQLHHLFTMFNLQKRFLSKTNMQFKKDKIWECKMDQKKMKQLFMNLAIDDNLELVPKEDLYKNKTRSVKKAENDSKKNIHTAAGKKIEVDLAYNSDKVHSSVIGNLKQQSKDENKMLLKTEGKIKMTYTAFTCHNSSAYETALHDLKSATSEISGVNLDQKKTTISTVEQFRKNIETSILNIGDTFPRREMEHYQENNQDSFHYNNDAPPHSIVMLNEINDTSEKGIHTESEKYRALESAEANSQQVKTRKNFLSFGKQMVTNLLKWTFEDYETSSPNNYIHSLSKRLTK